MVIRNGITTHITHDLLLLPHSNYFSSSYSFRDISLSTQGISIDRKFYPSSPAFGVTKVYYVCGLSLLVNLVVLTGYQRVTDNRYNGRTGKPYRTMHIVMDLHPHSSSSSLWTKGRIRGIHRVKWRHISVVAMRSPFCRSTRRTVCT